MYVVCWYSRSQIFYDGNIYKSGSTWTLITNENEMKAFVNNLTDEYAIAEEHILVFNMDDAI